MDASDRESTAATGEIPQPAPRSPVEAELRQLAERLRGSAAAPEPRGVCVFPVGDQARCAQTTELQCALLAGTWVADAECPAGPGAPGNCGTQTLGPVEEALTLLQSRLTAAAHDPSAPAGTCVYAAGNEACRAEMSALQCDLLGGVWFRSEGSPTAEGTA